MVRTTTSCSQGRVRLRLAACRTRMGGCEVGDACPPPSALRRAHQSERQVLRRTWRPRSGAFGSGEVRLSFRSEMVSCRMQGPALSGLVSWCDGRAYDMIAPAFSVGAVVRPLVWRDEHRSSSRRTNCLPSTGTTLAHCSYPGCVTQHGRDQGRRSGSRLRSSVARVSAPERRSHVPAGPSRG